MLEDQYILIVEDDFDLLWLIKKILTMNGFQVLTAVTAEGAIDEFSRNIFKIRAVILDLSLPDQNGEYVCREFLKAAPQLPVIVATGYEDRAQKKKLRRLGVQEYLVKPFDIMRLVKVISKIL